MKNIILKLLDFCNLLDYSGARLSLTNLGLIALIFKMVVSKPVDWPSVVAVIAALANYMNKRSTNQDANGN